MNILSIQSHVSFGHVGNSSAVFPMQRLGHEVWPIHTVHFSNHPGYGDFKGRVLEPALIDECMEGMAARGALERCDGILTGYMGAVATGAAILRAVHLVKAANPSAVYCCDPVIGDIGPGVYVSPGIGTFFQDHLLAHADIITPNQFELEYLSGLPVQTLAQVRAAIAAVTKRGPRMVVVTSLEGADTPADCLDIAAGNGQDLWRVRTPRLGIAANGAGDAIAALFLVHFLATHSPATALSHAASSVFGLLQRTMNAGSRELLTISAQDEFVSPTRIFTAELV